MEQPNQQDLEIVFPEESVVPQLMIGQTIVVDGTPFRVRKLEYDDNSPANVVAVCVSKKKVQSERRMRPCMQMENKRDKE